MYMILGCRNATCIKTKQINKKKNIIYSVIAEARHSLTSLMMLLFYLCGIAVINMLTAYYQQSIYSLKRHKLHYFLQGWKLTVCVKCLITALSQTYKNNSMLKLQSFHLSSKILYWAGNAMTMKILTAKSSKKKTTNNLKLTWLCKNLKLNLKLKAT